MKIILLILLQLFICNPQLTLNSPSIDGVTIHKNAWVHDDIRQSRIQHAYDVWWMDHVILLECENDQRDPNRRWDWWDAIWLCQINERWTTPPDIFYTDPIYQIDYCLEKRQWWTLFYWPWRQDKLSWERCRSYAKKRFTILTWQ